MLLCPTYSGIGIVEAWLAAADLSHNRERSTRQVFLGPIVAQTVLEHNCPWKFPVLLPSRSLTRLRATAPAAVPASEAENVAAGFMPAKGLKYQARASQAQSLRLLLDGSVEAPSDNGFGPGPKQSAPPESLALTPDP